MRWIFATFIIFFGGVLIVADKGLAPTVFSFIGSVPAGDKLGHFMMMGTLALLMNLSLKNRKVSVMRWRVLLGSMIVAVIATFEEFSQIFMSHRTFSFLDMLANFLGVYFLGRLALKFKEDSWSGTKIGFVKIALSGFFVLLIPAMVVMSYKQEVYEDIESVEPVEVAIVFGAGVKENGEPSDALGDRLITAAELYHAGAVEKLLVSGDNRFEHYNEPETMRDYLVNALGVPLEDIVVDYAGRRTYDTCVRASELWGIEEAILVSQGYHLPRAIMTCEALGIESTGFSASLQTYVFEEAYKFREIAAIYKALIDLYLFAPEYVGGEEEEL